jgi:hypothetical protein
MFYVLSDETSPLCSPIGIGYSQRDATQVVTQNTRNTSQFTHKRTLMFTHESLVRNSIMAGPHTHSNFLHGIQLWNVLIYKHCLVKDSSIWQAKRQRQRRETQQKNSVAWIIEFKARQKDGSVAEMCGAQRSRRSLVLNSSCEAGTPIW